MHGRAWVGSCGGIGHKGRCLGGGWWRRASRAATGSPPEAGRRRRERWSSLTGSRGGHAPCGQHGLCVCPGSRGYCDGVCAVQRDKVGEAVVVCVCEMGALGPWWPPSWHAHALPPSTPRVHKSHKGRQGTKGVRLVGVLGEFKTCFESNSTQLKQIQKSSEF